MVPLPRGRTEQGSSERVKRQKAKETRCVRNEKNPMTKKLLGRVGGKESGLRKAVKAKGGREEKKAREEKGCWPAGLGRMGVQDTHEEKKGKETGGAEQRGKSKKGCTEKEK